MLDYLCSDCAAHFEAVKSRLTAMEIPFVINPSIVRGLDYYVGRCLNSFPLKSARRAQYAPAAGTMVWWRKWAARHCLLWALPWAWSGSSCLWRKTGNRVSARKRPVLYILPMGDEAGIRAAALAGQLRNEGFSVLTDLTGRGLKAQMKYAGKKQVRFVLVLGEDELRRGRASVKNMDTGTETETALDALCDTFYSLTVDSAVEELTESILQADIRKESEQE